MLNGRVPNLRHGSLAMVRSARVTVLLLCSVVAGPASAQDKPDDKPDPRQDEALLRGANVPTDGAGLVAFLKKRGAAAADPDTVAALVKQLGSRQFRQREKAARDLVALGAPARAALQSALKDKD